MKKEIKVLKLITGEEIITRIVHSEEEQKGVYYTRTPKMPGLQDQFLHLETPQLVHPLPPNASGQLGVGLAPWCLAGKTASFKIETKHVIVILEPNPAMEKTYLSAITGITL